MTKIVSMVLSETRKCISEKVLLIFLLFICFKSLTEFARIRKEEYRSPFTDKANEVPSYMLEVYKEYSNPSNKICQDRTFVSLPNLGKGNGESICSSGEVSFNLDRIEEKGRFLHSARVFIEIQSSQRKCFRRNVVAALTFRNNDKLLGYTNILEGRYGSIDITEEAQRLWIKVKKEEPELGINFFILLPETLKKSCEDLYWRVSTLVVWQNKPKCEKKLRVTTREMVKSVSTVSFLLEHEAEETEGYEKDDVDGKFAFVSVKKASEKSSEFDLLSSRKRRSVPTSYSHNIRWKTDINLQNPLLKSLKEMSESKGLQGRETLSEIFFHNLLYYRREKRVKDVEDLIDTDVEINSSLSSSPDRSELINESYRNQMNTLEKIFRNPRKIYSVESSGKHQKRKTSAKRNQTNKTSPGKTKRCSLRKQIIEFEKIEWDWVIAPRKYASGRCAGTCEFPLDDSVAPTNYAILSAINRHVTGQGRYPSCVPSKMESLTLLFKDVNNHLVVKNFDDMIVRACACR